MLNDEIVLDQILCLEAAKVDSALIDKVFGLIEDAVVLVLDQIY